MFIEFCMFLCEQDLRGNDNHFYNAFYCHSGAEKRLTEKTIKVLLPFSV